MTSILAKYAQTQYNVHELIRKRWSARAFSLENIPEEQLMLLFEAAGWAASSMNEQPWKYRFSLRDDPEYNTYLDCLLPGNKIWANRASVIIVSICQTTFQKNGQTNRHAMYDVGAANTNLLLQASALDIYGHLIGGYDSEKAQSVFQLSEGEEIACFIALGYLDSPEILEEPFKTREITPRKRKTLEEYVKRGL